ncbi:Tripeptidyl-peptidase II [Bertholletia excelsa]
MGPRFSFVASITVLLFFRVVLGEPTDEILGHTKTFIIRVHNDLKPSVFSDVEDWYSSILRSLSSSQFDAQREGNGHLLHVYKTVFHGFSAGLTTQQAQELAKRPEVLGVFPDRVRQIQTTRSPEFLGLTSRKATGLITESDSGSNVIIGVLDTGISPKRRSFQDRGLGPEPSHWKGECQEGEKFTKAMCNRKIIGARYFIDGYDSYKANIRTSNNSAEVKSAIDSDGHGTHTASTAAGRSVANASLFGLATGVAAGMAQKARIAVYKTCWEFSCMESDILSAFDYAVQDGVDIISASIGGENGIPYHMDPIAIGSFGAMEQGIFVSVSAGNSGPGSKSVSNIAPWMTTVGAGTIDRKFPADLLLADGTVITGVSLYNDKPLPKKTFLPLIYAANASKVNQVIGWDPPSAAFCMPGYLDEKLVRGKIVLCDGGGIARVEKGLVVKEAGGVGVVVANVHPMGEEVVADPHLIPGLAIGESGGDKVRSYILSSKNPMATMVFHGTRVGVKPAPVVASFSSRGPSSESLYVLKPDLIAPGYEILAAWPDSVSPSGLDEDPRRCEFNILSGTSMSCPHVSGVAALLKGAHPDWSPAMIRSAMMTTAYLQDADGKSLLDESSHKAADVWATGAGHVDPDKAVDPGLVYDLTVDDYLDFLCASGYSPRSILRVSRKLVTCEGKERKPWNLNYPAISIDVNLSSQPLKFQLAVTRTATHVGNGAASYSVIVSPPRGVTLRVDPVKMEFKEKGEKQSYVVNISTGMKPRGAGDTELGKLTWSDGKHQVTSPIVVVWQK